MHTKEYRQYRFDNEFGWQVDRPVFIKLPFTAFGKKWEKGEHFNWSNYPYREEDHRKILRTINDMYLSGKIHHDSSREVEQKVGDRLGELNSEETLSLVRQCNAVIKKRVTTDKEYQNKKIKQSKLIDKQRGLIRAWLYRNAWMQEDYYKIRDQILEGKSVPKTQTEDTFEEPEESNNSAPE